MDNRELMIELFDNYEKLFTQKQIKVFKMYYFEDLTLDEIAKELSISKSAIGDSLKKTKQSLKSYEKKLNITKIKRRCKCKI